MNEILRKAQEFMSAEDLAFLRKADEYACETYGDAKHRHSGELYIKHAWGVADILLNMKLDVESVAAGLLHGVLKEPFNGDAEALKKRFGNVIYTIVEGTTKITSVKFDSSLAYQAENIRKMLLAMSSDIRILIVRLADRLHDMMSLELFPADMQQGYARETMELFAPLASRLGIDWMKRELEDLSFKYLYPREYADLVKRIKTSTRDRQLYVDEVKKLISERLREYGLTEFSILGRPKHLYSIYKKLIVQNIPLEKVYDKVAVRIFTKTVSACYEALGILHSLWLPVAGRFKDFISTPKSNMYQSLHTTVVGPYGEFMEVQIRTEEMDEIANDGIAAHWAYKEGKSISKKDAKLFHWLKQLVNSLHELKDPSEILETVKGELYEIDVYALTPNGEVKEFPSGSTTLDFAYAIHTEVGDHCTGAKINGRIVPLRTQLQNGDVVEIITAPNQKPNRGWLSIVKTSRAKSRIRHWLKKEEQERMLRVGRELCERQLRKSDISLKKLVKTGHIKEILREFNCNTLEELLRRVGAGKVTVKDIVNKLQPPEAKPEEGATVAELEEQTAGTEAVSEIQPGLVKPHRKPRGESAIVIDGMDDLLVRISQCCMPVPGDEVMGFITAGRGISVHKSDCKNFLATDPSRHIEVMWSDEVLTTHRVQIQVVAEDHKGLLAELGNSISSNDANVINLEAHTSSANLAVFNFVLEVENLQHLAKLLQQIMRIDGVMEAKRK